MSSSGGGEKNVNPLPRATLRLLASRLIAAARKVRSDPADEAWVRSILTPAEHDLWTRLSAYDRSHAVQVARRVEHRLAPTVYRGDTLWLSAALLHDIGKLQSELSMFERVIATLASKAVGVLTARRWAGSATAVKRRIGIYLIHGEIGAGMIRASGGREGVAAWTEVHQDYRSRDDLGIPSVVVEALLESDVGTPGASFWRRRQTLSAAILATALTVAAAILSVQLLVPPVVGLADNHDYQRVMGYAGFQHTTAVDGERYFAFLRTRYAIVAPGWFRSGYHSSETLLAFFARYAHLAFSTQPLFDIRLLGAINATLLLLALAGLIRACRELTVPTQALVAALLVFAFTDVGYVAPFNSFYSQTASLLFLLLTAAISAAAVRRGRLSGGLLLAYFASALLFVGSKPQERLAAPLLAVFGMGLAGVGLASAWRRAAVWLGIGLCAFSIWYGRHTPYTLREATIFQVVFDDLLAYSAAPATDAAELRLDSDWVRHTGSSPYAADSPLLDPGFRERFLHQVGYRQILRFYLRHPARLVGRIERASLQAWSLRPALGNFERSPEHPEQGLASQFSVWSRMHGWLGERPLFWIVLLLVGNLAAALATYRRSTPGGRRFREGVIVLVLMSGLAFAVCALAQAPPDLSRALYAYHALCDLLLIADAGWIAEGLAATPRPSGRRGKLRTGL